MEELRALLERQSGVVSRAQARQSGLSDHALRRLIRRRALVRVRPGVYLDHTGAPSWTQQAWSAVLATSPSALRGESALRALDREVLNRPFEGVVKIAVDESRRVLAGPGIDLRRVTGLGPRTLWHASPPRMRTEEAVLDVAASAVRDVEAIAALTDVVRQRHTTPARLSAALDARHRLPRRRLLVGVLRDLEHGTASVLEHGYLTRVERPHGLPRAARQRRLTGLSARHDVVYERARVVVELDGRLFHSHSSARLNDLERDLAAAAVDHVTVRLGWGQVFGTPCHTAEQLLRLLRLRGWRGRGRACAACG